MGHIEQFLDDHPAVVAIESIIDKYDDFSVEQLIDRDELVSFSEARTILGHKKPISQATLYRIINYRKQLKPVGPFGKMLRKRDVVALKYSEQ
jgi:hypothetical protein